MTTLDTFGGYVNSRLLQWGDEFALHRNFEWLGYASKNMLQVLIEHKGEMPGRTTGFKPMEVDAQAHEIELLVTDIARDPAQKSMACCLRAYYCGSGRRKVERWETARLLIATARPTASLPTLRQYMGLVEDGRLIIRRKLVDIRRAA